MSPVEDSTGSEPPEPVPNDLERLAALWRSVLRPYFGPSEEHAFRLVAGESIPGDTVEAINAALTVALTKGARPLRGGLRRQSVPHRGERERRGGPRGLGFLGLSQLSAGTRTIHACAVRTARLGSPS